MYEGGFRRPESLGRHRPPITHCKYAINHPKKQVHIRKESHMIEFLLSVFDLVLNVVTLGWWGRSQGDKLVADHWTE